MKAKGMILYVLGAAALAAACASGASAQKSSDTLRIAVGAPMSSIDLLFRPTPDMAFFSFAVLETMAEWDQEAAKYLPSLASAWRRVDPTTLEFTLNDKVKWHDGTAFGADDVIGTIAMWIDPKSRLRNKEAYAFIAKAEKLGPHRVRVTTKAPYALDLATLTRRMQIYPTHVVSKLPNMALFGKSPTGTGPYRAASIDANKGVMLERYAAYASTPEKGTIGRIHGIPIPDPQTQIAQFMVSQVDLLRDPSPDVTKQLLKNPDARKTENLGYFFLYLTLDMAGRSGRAEFKDKRVREALFKAVDRNALIRTFLPDGSFPIDAVCSPRQWGCAASVKPVAYDPAGAKALLAEAGHPNGLEFVINAVGPANADIAQFVAGNLREIGVRASVNQVTFGAYRNAQRDGTQQALLQSYNSAGFFDAYGAIQHIAPPSPRNFHRDAELTRLWRQAETEMDDSKRAAIYDRWFSRVNTERVYLPLAGFPTAFVHSKDVRIKKGSDAPYGTSATDLSWN